MEEIESDDNRKQAKELFEEEYQRYFEKKLVSLEEAKEDIHKELLRIERQRITCIEYIEKVKQTVGDNTNGEYGKWQHRDAC